MRIDFDTTHLGFDAKGVLSSFSGTDICNCGGRVEYNCKRSDGAELGECLECHIPYIDPRGSRIASLFDMVI